ncbi:MAG: hypothetical protein NXI22_16835, partial [bacterium]|nr:hypothetical protein [bacterium]
GASKSIGHGCLLLDLSPSIPAAEFQTMFRCTSALILTFQDRARGDRAIVIVLGRWVFLQLICGDHGRCCCRQRHLQ